MSWLRARELAHVFDRWTRLVTLMDESEGTDESALVAALRQLARWPMAGSRSPTQ